MTAVVIQESVRIPPQVTRLESFREWARSPGFPEKGRFSFLEKEVWVDLSPEELYTHNRVEGELAAVLTTLLKTHRLGQFFHDRALLSHVKAGLSTEPDGTFVSWDSFRTNRLRLLRGVEGYVELLGSPDLTIEVVSATSVIKDTQLLRRLYWLAGVKEYWLVDARGSRPQFDILRRERRGYVVSRKRSGWISSPVLGRSFKLTAAKDELGHPEYSLSVR
jgi:Uma2 family endonuclease